MRKKLIEVALPLDAINAASATEKSIRHGHPSTLHLWWARRPLAACRAVLFASIVDDPSSDPDRFPTVEAQDAERQRLFRLIETMVPWAATKDEKIMGEVRAEIMRATGGNPPPVLDPFCGGGSIPLEAQRLGLEAHGSDLNPVAVLITKALIEIPPKFVGKPPVNPADRAKIGAAGNWRGAQGLAADVRYYGRWMRDEARKRIGHLYPTVTLPSERGGGEATVIAWLWARTVKCPNPACGAQMPLVSNFALSTKKGKGAWVEPEIDRTESPPRVRFMVCMGEGVPPEPPKLGRGAKFRCLCCGNVTEDAYIKSEGMAKRMGAQLMAIVAEGKGERIYLAPTPDHEAVATSAQPTWGPEQQMPENPRWFSPPAYGFKTYQDIFTPRQLVALTTFSNLVGEARARVLDDARAAGTLPADDRPLHTGGPGPAAYADAVATYLAMGVSRMTDICNALCRWEVSKTQVRNLFGRQAIPMIWDYAEPNVFSRSAGDFEISLGNLVKALEATPAVPRGDARQVDAITRVNGVDKPIISTDPPYYDNIGYADLSDFFYVWLRRSLGDLDPSLFGTVQTPKVTELIADLYRHHGSREEARNFFENGLAKVFHNIHARHHPDYPLTIYYAYKQSESDEADDDDLQGTFSLNGNASIASTGWETMLTGVINAGFQITGTWPMRSEMSNRPIANGTNALASSIVLVCRPRPVTAAVATRAEFVRALNRELPAALIALQHGNIAPVDLAQASIGPGMAVFSRYAKVIEADGKPMRVRSALQLINAALDAAIGVGTDAGTADYDRETRWAKEWIASYAFAPGPYGTAETLATAKGVSVAGIVTAGIIQSQAGKVRLLRPSELRPDWNPATDMRLTAWETTHHLIRALDTGGEDAAAVLLGKAGAVSEAAKELAYALYVLCERKGWNAEARDYNTLVVAWPTLTSRMAELAHTVTQPEQITLGV